MSYGQLLESLINVPRPSQPPHNTSTITQLTLYEVYEENASQATVG